MRAIDVLRTLQRDNVIHEDAEANAPRGTMLEQRGVNRCPDDACEQHIITRGGYERAMWRTWLGRHVATVLPVEATGQKLNTFACREGGQTLRAG
jgi:hypothetical protein